jgi:hypothetical protein
MSPKYSSTHFCFWIVALFFLLWNLVGVLSFFTHTFISDASLAALPENERALYTQYPLWTTIVFGAAVFYGFTSALGLLMKKKWARIAASISFITVLIQMIHNVFYTDSIAVYGIIEAITMPVLLVVFSLLLLLYTNRGVKKGWLN